MPALRSYPRPASLAAALYAAVAVALAPIAAAGPAPGAGPTTLSDSDKRATAKRYVDAGLAAQQAKDYASAVDFFLRAYDLVPHPLLIYNMAEAHRLAGHNAEALAHYTRYLAADPGGARSQDAANQLEPLRRAVQAEEAARAEQARLAEEKRLAEEQRLAEEKRVAEDKRLAEEKELREQARRAEDARAAEEQRRVDAELAMKRGAARRRGDLYRWTGVGVGVLGLVGVGTGVYFGARAATLSDEVSRTYDPNKASEGTLAEQVQVASLSAGAVLLVAGATLVFLGWRTSHRGPRLEVAPAVDAHSAAMTVTGGW